MLRYRIVAPARKYILTEYLPSQLTVHVAILNNVIDAARSSVS